MTATITLRCPIRDVNGDKWASLDFAGIKRLDVVAYKVKQLQDLSFAGGHRVRQFRFWDNIHILTPDGIALDIEEVKPASPPARRRNR